MNLRTLTFISIVIAIYALINYYIGLRGAQALGGSRLSLHLKHYWFWAVLILSCLYPLTRFAGHYLSADTSRVIILAASYWLGIIYYLFLIILGLDLIRLLDRWLGFLPEQLASPHPSVFMGIFVLMVILLAYGTWNARHPVVSEYEINVPQKSSSLHSIRVVMVSDIHLGWIVGSSQLNGLINRINDLHPDLVLLPGDIIDEGVDPSAEREIPALFARLSPPLGTYAALGNHEYISGQADEVASFLGQGGVKVLRDQWVELEQGLYIVGRDEAFGHSGGRMDLHALMKGIEKNKLPVFIMDHKPDYLQEPEQEGVDVQFSGHTHLGQFAPNQLVTGRIFEQDWGYLRKNNFQLIVSCGFGTWGPPIRIGNRPEIVLVKVNFIPSGQ